MVATQPPRHVMFGFLYLTTNIRIVDIYAIVPERRGGMERDRTWKAEEAVPKTKPFGKLPLLIPASTSAEDAVIWKPEATTIATQAINNLEPSMSLGRRRRKRVLCLVREGKGVEERERERDGGVVRKQPEKGWECVLCEINEKRCGLWSVVAIHTYTLI